MTVQSIPHQTPVTALDLTPASKESPAAIEREATLKNDSELREAFDTFVGQTFYGQLLKAMRSTVNKPAYFHGGRAEEVFQSQLDQLLIEEVSHASAERVSDPMFDLFMLSRQ